jgi:hypothetical protein
MRQAVQQPGPIRKGNADYAPFIRSAMMVVIVASLLPILLGAVAENETLRREQFKQMRAEHMRRIAEGRARLEERRRLRESMKQGRAPSVGWSGGPLHP